MKYRYETEKKDYTDLASGRVLYHAPGSAPFPVRLASEIFCRALALLKPDQKKNGYKIYDPCCGSGYLLTVLGFLHAGKIREIWATDYDAQILETAARNLSLLTPEGLRKREAELREYIKRYGKPSHVDALDSVEKLKSLQKQEPVKITCRQRDITKPGGNPVNDVNMIITDLPYGNLVSWQGHEVNPVNRLFENIWQALDLDNAVVVIVTDGQKLEHPQFQRVRQLKAGKRRVSFFRPLV
ncbi:MAG: hypothetical protein WB502_00810 [Thermoactinomyces sp.]